MIERLIDCKNNFLFVASSPCLRTKIEILLTLVETII